MKLGLFYLLLASVFLFYGIDLARGQLDAVLCGLIAGIYFCDAIGRFLPRKKRGR